LCFMIALAEIDWFPGVRGGDDEPLETRKSNLLSPLKVVSFVERNII